MSDDVQSQCCQCGAILTEGRCLSCEHLICPDCPVYIPKPSYEELTAVVARLRTLLRQHAIGCVNGGPSICRLCQEADQFLSATREYQGGENV